MGQCSQCIKRDCGFPGSNYQGRTPEEYETYLKDRIFKKYGPKTPKPNDSPGNLTIENELSSVSELEHSSIIGKKKNQRKPLELTKYTLSYSNILTPCSTQRNIDPPLFLSKRNIEKALFNSPVRGRIPTSSKNSEDQYPSFFSCEEATNSREDLARPIGFNVQSMRRIPLKSKEEPREEH